jgi:hypothetical protein
MAKRAQRTALAGVRLPLLDRQPARISTVQFEQIKRTQHVRSGHTDAGDEFKHGKANLISLVRLTIGSSGGRAALAVIVITDRDRLTG